MRVSKKPKTAASVSNTEVKAKSDESAIVVETSMPKEIVEIGKISCQYYYTLDSTLKSALIQRCQPDFSDEEAIQIDGIDLTVSDFKFAILLALSSNNKNRIGGLAYSVCPQYFVRLKSIEKAVNTIQKLSI